MPGLELAGLEQEEEVATARTRGRRQEVVKEQEATTDFKPGFGPGVLIGPTSVWRDGRQCVTEVEGLFPPGLTSTLDCGGEEVAGQSWGVRLWRCCSSLTMQVLMLLLPFLLLLLLHHPDRGLGSQTPAEWTEHDRGPRQGQPGECAGEGEGDSSHIGPEPSGTIGV